MKYIILTALLSIVMISTAAADGPPITLKERSDSAKLAAETFLDSFEAKFNELTPEHKTRLKLSPKITQIRDEDETLSYRYHGVNVTAELSRSKTIGVRLHCSIHEDAMQVDWAQFEMPYHPSEAHPSRNAALDIMDSFLRASMDVSDRSEQHRTAVLSDVRSRRALMFKQLSRTHIYQIDGMSYTLRSNRGKRNIPPTLQLSVSTIP